MCFWSLLSRTDGIEEVLRRQSDLSELEMHYPVTLRAALWIILAAMAFWSVVSAVLVGLAQRFILQEKNDRNSAQNTQLKKPMRLAVHPTKFAELYFFLLLLGAVVLTGLDAGAAQAFDSAAINTGAPGHAWCVTRDGGDAPAVRQLPNLWHGGYYGSRLPKIRAMEQRTDPAAKIIGSKCGQDQEAPDFPSVPFWGRTVMLHFDMKLRSILGHVHWGSDHCSVKPALFIVLC
jgi:hypothetical protein